MLAKYLPSAAYTVDWVNVPEIVELFVRKERLNVSENVSLYHFRGEVERKGIWRFFLAEKIRMFARALDSLQ